MTAFRYVALCIVCTCMPVVRVKPDWDRGGLVGVGNTDWLEAVGFCLGATVVPADCFMSSHPWFGKTKTKKS